VATPQDRAAVVTRAIMRIFADVRDPDEQHQQIEQYLRDEIADAMREAAADRLVAD
jgi:hypothetical protein